MFENGGRDNLGNFTDLEILMSAILRKISNHNAAILSMLLFAVIFGFVRSLSDFVLEQNMIAFDLQDAAIGAAGCLLALLLAYMFINAPWHFEASQIRAPRFLWLEFFVLLVGLHGLCWMVYWPADISHDNMYILMKGLDMSHQHPILYNAYVTLLKEAGMMFGSSRYGVIGYILVQILAVDAVLAGLMLRLLKMRIPLILKIFSVLYYLFVPLFAVFNVEMIKDTLWSIALAVYTLELYEIISRDVPLRRNWLKFWVATFLVMGLRNNGVYIVGGTLAVLLFSGGVRRGRGIWTAFLVAILTFIGQIFAMRAINSHQLFQEKVGVPLQQIAAVAKNDGIVTEEQKNFIETIVPLRNLKQRYNPYTADAIKWGNPEFKIGVLEQHPREFLRVWSEMLRPNFKIYVLAYLQESYWWWAPRQEGQIKYLYTWHHEQKHLASFAAQNQLYEKPIITGQPAQYLQQYYDLSGCFLREGVLFWLLAAMALLYGFKRRSWRALIVYVPCFLLWLTLMLTAPIAYSFRFVLSYAYLLPFFAALLFTDKKSEDENLLHTWGAVFRRRWQKYLFLLVCVVGCFFAAKALYVKIMNNMPLAAHIGIYETNDGEPNFEVYENGVRISAPAHDAKTDKVGVELIKIGNRADLTIKALKNTEIYVDLSGAGEDDAQASANTQIKYRAFEVDDKPVLTDYVIEANEPYTYRFAAQKGKVYHLKLKWRKP